MRVSGLKQIVNPSELLIGNLIKNLVEQYVSSRGQDHF